MLTCWFGLRTRGIELMSGAAPRLMLLPHRMSHRPIFDFGFSLSLVFTLGDRAEVGVLSWGPPGEDFILVGSGSCLCGVLLWCRFTGYMVISCRHISSFRKRVHLKLAKPLLSTIS